MNHIYSFLSGSFLSVCFFGCGSNGIGGNDDIQYAALGASDAAGIGASSPSHGYVYLIKDGIEESGKSTHLMNYGVPDIEIGGIRDIELKLLDQGRRPDVVTLFAGGNDVISGSTASHFERDLAAILEHLSKIEGVKVFVADLPALEELPRFRETPDNDVTKSRIGEFNAIIHRQAQKFGAHVVTLSQEAADDRLVSNDGLHPNNQGYEVIANLFLEEILPAI